MQAETRTPPFAPGPRGLPLLGTVLEVWRDPIELLTRGAREHGDTVRFRFGPYEYLLVNHVEGIQHVLQAHQKNYVKSRNYHGVKLVLGQGLLTSEGDFWRRQRKLAQPAFHHQRLAGFADTFSRATGEMLDRWSALPEASTFDLHEEMMRLTFRMVGETLFSTNLERDAKAIGEALGVAIRYANEYVEQVVRVPTWVPTPRNVRFRRALRTLDTLVFRIIEEHRRAPDDHRGDLLSMLMSATDESGQERMTDRQLRDEVMTLILAGHETTAVALSWTFRLLSEHPEVERRLCEEATRVLGDRRACLEDLPRLEYTERVLQESMRLLPPAWCFEREAVEDDVIGGFRVDAGTVIAICPWVLHRHPSYWDDPERFDPDRFTPERSAGRHRYAYLPFGDGPRVCIGKGFAMMEAKIALAAIARAHRIELVPEHPIELEPGITLRPKHGMRVVLRTRGEKPSRPSGRLPVLLQA